MSRIYDALARQATLYRLIFLVGLCMALAGCATDGTSLPSFGCTVFKPITYSRKNDTRETVRQIVGHNAVGAKSCGWRHG